MAKSKHRGWLTFFRRIGSSKHRRELWGNPTEVIFGLTLVLAGTTLMAWTIAVQLQVDQWLVQWGISNLVPKEPQSTLAFAVRSVISTGLILIGFFQLLPMALASSASEERRGNVFRIALETGESEGNVPNQHYPSVGKVTGVRRRSSVGRFVIPLSKRPQFRLLFWVFVSVLFFSVAAVSGLLAWSAWLFADMLRFFVILLIFLGMVALGVIGAIQAGKRVLFQTRYGWSLLELKDYPLRVGEENFVYLKQTGDIVLDKLIVTIECWEEATYRQGTDVCTDRKNVFSKELISREVLKLASAPMTISSSFQVPADLMHSFYGNNNSVSWNFRLTGKKRRTEPLVRNFPVIVLPPNEGVANKAAETQPV